MTKYLRPLLAVCTFVAVQAITCTVVYVLLILECMRENAARNGGSMFSASSYPNVLPELTVGNTVEILVVSCGLICPVDFLSTKTGRKERISITQISIISISIITLCF